MLQNAVFSVQYVDVVEIKSDVNQFRPLKATSDMISLVLNGSKVPLQSCSTNESITKYVIISTAYRLNTK